MRTTKEFIEFIFSLCGGGVSGDEKDAAAAAARVLSRFMPVHSDALGNVVGKKDGGGPHILLDAHIDRIGMIVTSVGADGFVKAAQCGSIDRRVLPAAEVVIMGKEDVFGVITSTPPHLSKGAKEAPELSELSIDTGFDGEKAKELVSLGDRIILKSYQHKLVGGRICSAAQDNRVGVAAILRCLEMLEGKDFSCGLTVLFSVQEETTGGGAKTGSFLSEADEAIIVDVGFASAPDIPSEKSAPLGGGVMIGFAPALCRDMSLELLSLAEKSSIPCTRDVMGGATGTNAESVAFSRGGKRTALLSIPQRNMHTAAEVCDIEDIENTARLICSYILKKGGVIND